VILGFFSPVGVGVIFSMSTLLCAALLCSLALVIWLGFDDWLIGLLWGDGMWWLAGWLELGGNIGLFFSTLHFFIFSFCALPVYLVRLFGWSVGFILLLSFPFFYTYSNDTKWIVHPFF